MNKAYISIGSNTAKEHNVPACFHRLHKEFSEVRLSSVYATAPVGPPGQADFWNAAAFFLTALTVAELADKLKEIEADFGRKRVAGNKYADRTLDLDIVLFNDLITEDGPVPLPNPQLERFAFVLAPMAELAPTIIHPVSKLTLHEMNEHFDHASQHWERVGTHTLRGYEETGGMRKPVLLITGGASKIGQQISLFYARCGYAVAIHYNQSSQLAEQLRDQILAFGGSASTFQYELEQPEVPQELVQAVVERWGYIDVLINNASLFYPTPLAELTTEQWASLFAVNVRAPHFLMQAAAPHLAKQRGSIVNIADIYAERPLAEHSAYCASKAALLSITQSLANELAPAVRVNAVEPGAIMFPQGYAADKIEALVKQVPMARAGRADDIVQTVYFLTDGPSYLNGTIINVDGGRLRST